MMIRTTAFAFNRTVRWLGWLSFTLTDLLCSCDYLFSPNMNAPEVLGTGAGPVTTIHYRDFGGISTHGELFDFQECAVDIKGLDTLVLSQAFAHAPDYSGYRNFYRAKLRTPSCTTWQRTPIDSTAKKIFYPTISFGNLLGDENSSEFIKQNYLTTPGNFYAYFAAYPAGTILYVLVPATGRLFIIRKRG